MSTTGSTAPQAEQGAEHSAPAAARADSSPGGVDVEGRRSAHHDGERPRAHRFPKSCHVRRRREFLRIQGQGHRIHSRHLVFQFLPGEGPESRLGITVSRKVGNAVVRNRIKRWVREAFRRHPELRPGGSDRPYDLVITAKRDVGDFSWTALHDEIVQVIGRFLTERGARSGRRGRHPAGAPTPDRGSNRPR